MAVFYIAILIAHIYERVLKCKTAYKAFFISSIAHVSERVLKRLMLSDAKNFENRSHM